MSPRAVATGEGDLGPWRPDLAISTRCMAGGGGRCVCATEDEREELGSAWWRGGSRDGLRCGQAPGDRANPRRGQGGQPPPASPPLLPPVRRRVTVFAPADPAPRSVPAWPAATSGGEGRRFKREWGRGREEEGGEAAGRGGGSGIRSSGLVTGAGRWWRGK
jgi:hypothetical protein